MTQVTNFNLTRTVTSKEALRRWKSVTDDALREPVVITSHGRPRHVLMAYDDYRRLRSLQRQAYRTAELPDDLSRSILADLDNLWASSRGPDDGDTFID